MPELIVMRLADFTPLPGNDTERVCSECRERVTIGRSGQRVLADYDDVKIICNVCVKPPGDDVEVLPAPGALAEVLERLTGRKAN
jgi:hypothetical protein